MENGIGHECVRCRYRFLLRHCSPVDDESDDLRFAVPSKHRHRARSELASSFTDHHRRQHSSFFIFHSPFAVLAGAHAVQHVRDVLAERPLESRRPLSVLLHDRVRGEG